MTVLEQFRLRVAQTAWRGSLGPFRVFQQSFVIRSSDPELAGFLDEAYTPMAAATSRDDAASSDGSPAELYSVLAPTSDGPGAVFRQDELIGWSEAPSRVLAYLVWAINRQVIERTDHLLLLHAAGASTDDATVILPAPMESGKTTLVAGLSSRGLSYLSDEAIAVAEDLSVQGYPKPLSIDPGSWATLQHLQPQGSDHLLRYFEEQWQVPATRITSVSGRRHAQLLVFPRYESGARLRVEALSPAEAVGAAAPCTFAPDRQRLGLDRVRRLAALAESIPAARIVYGDLDDACDWIIGELGP